MLANTMAKSRLNDRMPKITDRILFHRRFHSTNLAQLSPFLGFSNLNDFDFNILDFIDTLHEQSKKKLL